MSEDLHHRFSQNYRFQFYNALSFQICLGTPLILFARELGASATTLGLLSGMPALLGILQLLTSRFVEQLGYRRMMLSGWGSRVWFLLFLIAMPWMVRIIPQEAVVNLTLAIIFIFALLRGLTSCAWTPWITALVPSDFRGEYLSRERAFLNVGSILALFISAAILTGQPSMDAYSLVFLASFIGGVVSLHYLRKMPDIEVKPISIQSSMQISWKEMLADTNFTKILLFGMTVAFTLSAHVTIIVLFLREETRLKDSEILWLNCMGVIAATLAILRLGKFIDRKGSRPFMGIVTLWWGFSSAVWFFITGHDSSHFGLPILLLMALGDVTGGIYELANSRLIMNSVGNRPGAPRYFALYAVCISLISAGVPVFWGILLDILKTWHWDFFDLSLNRYSLYFLVRILMFIPIIMLLARIREDKAASSTEFIHQIFVAYPARGLSYLMQQFR